MKNDGPHKNRILYNAQSVWETFRNLYKFPVDTNFAGNVCMSGTKKQKELKIHTNCPTCRSEYKGKQVKKAENIKKWKQSLVRRLAKFL